MTKEENEKRLEYLKSIVKNHHLRWKSQKLKKQSLELFPYGGRQIQNKGTGQQDFRYQLHRSKYRRRRPTPGELTHQEIQPSLQRSAERR